MMGVTNFRQRMAYLVITPCILRLAQEFDATYLSQFFWKLCRQCATPFPCKDMYIHTPSICVHPIAISVEPRIRKDYRTKRGK